ncbi:unnamed protein product, partial [Pylaiella littoralis]
QGVCRERFFGREQFWRYRKMAGTFRRYTGTCFFGGTAFGGWRYQQYWRYFRRRFAIWRYRQRWAGLYTTTRSSTDARVWIAHFC